MPEQQIEQVTAVDHTNLSQKILWAHEQVLLQMMAGRSCRVLRKKVPPFLPLPTFLPLH